MPEDIVSQLRDRDISASETDDVSEIIASSDVLYVTRVQKERFEDLTEYEAVKGSYVITPELLVKAKENMIVMHPLPRVGEIDYAVDSDKRAAYFRQMKNGMYLRMALLAAVLGRI
jgi:aspartate carbamoyltransferase catalytic subunit